MKGQLTIKFRKEVVIIATETCDEKLTFMDKWCEQATTMLKRAHPEWSEIKLKTAVEKAYLTKIKDPKCSLQNNYRNRSTRTTISIIFTILISGKFILGGDGCIFMQHDVKLSLITDWIQTLKAKRTAEKDLRDSFDKGTVGYALHDLAQNNVKIMMNSLYGILGYMRFYLFNVNLAQATTAMGQSIICTATCHFENYISDNLKFINTTEVAIYINNIEKDFYNLNEKQRHFLSRVPPVTHDMCGKRIADKVGFQMSTVDIKLIASMIMNMGGENNVDCLKLLYYKNNLSAFFELQIARGFTTTLLNSIVQLHNGNIKTFDQMDEEWCDTIADRDSGKMVRELIEMLDVLVLYRYQIYDRVRRTKYTDKSAVLYCDTDSNFLSVFKFIMFTMSLAEANKSNEAEFIFKSVNIFAMILMDSICKVYEVFTLARNITPKWGKLLNMKNELYFPIIVFGNSKKRYYGIMKLKEGKLIKGIENMRLVAGFDFKKAGTKEEVRRKCFELIDNFILLAEEICLRDILHFVRMFEESIELRLKEGDNTYYRQLTVQPAARYKAPLSNPGYKAVHIWNAFTPENGLSFPAEVDLVPVTLDTGMTDRRYMLMREDPDAFFASKDSKAAVGFRYLYENHHDIFLNYYHNILRSPNEYEWTMSITCIAKPRDLEEIPPWLEGIINTKKIVSDVINLINPIIGPLGPSIQQLTSTSSHYTNMVEI